MGRLQEAGRSLRTKNVIRAYRESFLVNIPKANASSSLGSEVVTGMERGQKSRGEGVEHTKGKVKFKFADYAGTKLGSELGSESDSESNSESDSESGSKPGSKPGSKLDAVSNTRAGFVIEDKNALWKFDIVHDLCIDTDHDRLELKRQKERAARAVKSRLTGRFLAVESRDMNSTSSSSSSSSSSATESGSATP